MTGRKLFNGGEDLCLCKVNTTLFIVKHPRTVMFVLFHFAFVIIVNYTAHVGRCILQFLFTLADSLGRIIGWVEVNCGSLLCGIPLAKVGSNVKVAYE